MLYRIAHIIQDKLPILWELIEWVNSLLFTIRYGRKLSFISKILQSYSEDYVLQEATLEDIDYIVSFFEEQPEESFSYFKPHRFDAKTIKKLIRRRSYLFFVVKKDEKVVGYFFLRCFFTGKCFRGKIVHYQYRGRGIAKLMGKASMDIAAAFGIRMFGTISTDNRASLASASAVNDVRVIKELPNNYLYIEYLPKE